MILNNIYFKKPSEFKKNELIDCFNKFYPQKSKFLIKNWEWLYRIKMFGVEPIVMMYENSTIGFAGSISANIIIENKIVRAKWFVDFIIDPKKRNLGLGKILTKKWMDDDFMNLTFCNNISLGIFKKLGWVESTPVYDSKLVLNPLKFFPLTKNINTNFFRNTFNLVSLNKNITPIKIGNNYQKIIELFDNHNQKITNLTTYMERNENWLNWRIFESPFANRYLLFEYNSSFIIIDHFFLNKIKRLSVIFFSFNNENDKKILLDNLLVWSRRNNIDAIWHIFMENSFFKRKIFQKILKLNFAFYQKDLKENQKFFDLQGLDGDNDLLFYNNDNINC